MQRFLDGEDLAGYDTFRIPSPAVGRMIALTSLPLEHLAASFIIDASHSFAIDSSWEWPNLTSLVLTSQLPQAGRGFHQDRRSATGSGGDGPQDATARNLGDLERQLKAEVRDLRWLGCLDMIVKK
jgi:hypothetical protein